MKRLHYYIMTLCFVSATAFVACDKDDAPSADAIDSSQFKQVENFTDPRDGKVYRCIQVGNQIWMAENLAYYPPLGSADGCYTWKEETYVGGPIALTDDEWYQAALALATEMPDWGAYMALGNYWDGNRTNMENTVFPMMAQYGMPVSDAYLTRLAEKEEELEIEKGEAQNPILAPKHTAEAEATNGNYSKTYGYLYTLDAARKAVPEGWRLPSDQDWMKLEAALGMAPSEIERNNAWRGINAGTYLKEGGLSMFEAKLGGCNGYVPATNSMNYINLNKGGYFWTSEETTIDDNGMTDSTDTPTGNEGGTTDESDKGEEEEESTAIKEGVVRFVTIYSSQIWRGTTRLNNGYRETTYSVRCVKDIN